MFDNLINIALVFVVAMTIGGALPSWIKIDAAAQSAAVALTVLPAASAPVAVASN